MRKTENSFWASLGESIMEMVFGSYQLEAWRAEKKQRVECERVMRRYMEEAGQAMSEGR